MPPSAASTTPGSRSALPGVVVCVAVAAVALGAHLALAAAGLEVPWLTLAVVGGLAFGQLPVAQHRSLAAGTSWAGRALMRAGIVLLGLQVSLGQLVSLGLPVAVATVAVLLAAFVVTLVLARVVGLPGEQPMLMAAGFSICGASAIGAMAEARGASQRDQAVPIALVTLCGTAAIAVLPLAQSALGLDADQFGRWVGASVHDVGQVVATAAIAGPAALGVAVAVKLLRVLCLAPIVALAGLRSRRSGRRPAIVPWFIIGFLVAVLARTFLPFTTPVLEGIAWVQQALLATALVGVLSRVRIVDLIRQESRSMIVAAGASLFIAVAALGTVAVL